MIAKEKLDEIIATAQTALARTNDCDVAEWLTRIHGLALEIQANGVACSRCVFPSDGVDLHEVERGLVIQALSRARGNQTRAAKLLGLTRDQVRYRIAKFGLGDHCFRNGETQ